MRPFHPFFRNPHLLTIAGNFWRRAIDEVRFPTRPVTYSTTPGTQVLIHENRPSGLVKGEVFLHHGLEGSSRSGYMISLTQCLLEAGYAVHRINMRSCGGTEHLTDTLYHSGLTQDVRAILEKFQAEQRGPRFLIGFSLGGNVTLKLVGELREHARLLLAGAIAVSTPIDLHACVRRLGAAENRLYERRFVRGLRARYLRRHLAFPDRFPIEGLDRVSTVFDFDNLFTAPAFGFGNAPNYYATQSALGFLAGIRLPVLMVQAKDDPMIPFSIFESAEVSHNQWIQLLATDHGGHLGYIARHRPRFWLDPIICAWLDEIRNKQVLESV